MSKGSIKLQLHGRHSNVMVFSPGRRRLRRIESPAGETLRKFGSRGRLPAGALS
jgi:hypothetical protein